MQNAKYIERPSDKRQTEIKQVRYKRRHAGLTTVYGAKNSSDYSS